MEITKLLALSPCALFFCGGVSASESPSFGGPDSVDNTIADNKKGSQKPWRESLAEDHGITLGLDYNALAIYATDPNQVDLGALAGTDDSSAAGVARFYGSWNLIGKESGNTGGISWKIEHRHSYTDLSPKFHSLNGGINPAGIIGSAYSDQGTRLTLLHWKQKFNGGKTTLIAGWSDVSDYVDTYALGSPWSGFTNLAFSTGSAAMGLPDDGVLTLAVGHMITNNVYVIAGIADANGKSDDPLDGFDSLFNQHDLFTTLELGWTASQDRIYTDNVHLTVWQLDATVQDDGSYRHGKEDSKGVNFSASYFATEKVMPFLRGGFSEGDASLTKASVSAGLGYYALGSANNNLGFAVNWAQPNDQQVDFGPFYKDKDQYTAELYYNIGLGKHVNITPDIQYIKNPALSSEDSTWVMGIRVNAKI
ncbi:MAG: carbohydrate porin [Psychromonas sp.]